MYRVSKDVVLICGGNIENSENLTKIGCVREECDFYCGVRHVNLIIVQILAQQHISLVRQA